MVTGWVVLIEAEREPGSVALGVGDLERLVRLLAAHSPSGLWAVDRYAVQLVVPAASPDAAIGPALGHWREALDRLGLPVGDVVRLEVKTADEAEAELRAAEQGAAVHHEPASEEALRAAYVATRQLLSIRSRPEAAAVVTSLAVRLGAELVTGQCDDAKVMDLDLSFDVGDPVRPSVDPFSITRLQLEEVLPTVLLDALRMLRLLEAGRQDSESASQSGDTSMPAAAGS